VGYLWSVQYFDRPGNAGRGKAVFGKKNCGSCHRDASSGAPDLSARAGGMTPFAMVDVLWKHGPAMKSRMDEKHLAWPRFDGSEMADLIAYLNR
jgi:mono/diheme cytochrome c family protein